MRGALGVVAEGLDELTNPFCSARLAVILSSGGSWSAAVDSNPRDLRKETRARIHQLAPAEAV